MPGAPGRAAARRPGQGAHRRRRRAASGGWRGPPELSDVPALEVTVFERTPPAEWSRRGARSPSPRRTRSRCPTGMRRGARRIPQDAAADRRLPARRRQRSPAWSRSWCAAPAGGASCSRPATARPTSARRPARPPTRAAVAARGAARARGVRRGWELWRLERCVAGSPWLGDRGRRGRPGTRCCAGARSRRSWSPTCATPTTSWTAGSGATSRGCGGGSRRDHAVVVRTSDGPQEARRDLGELLRLHAARWGSGTFPPSVRAFHADFAARAAEHGWLRLHTLEVDGRPAAVLYGWRLEHARVRVLAGLRPRLRAPRRRRLAAGERRRAARPPRAARASTCCAATSSTSSASASRRAPARVAPRRAAPLPRGGRGAGPLGGAARVGAATGPRARAASAGCARASRLARLRDPPPVAVQQPADAARRRRRTRGCRRPARRARPNGSASAAVDRARRGEARGVGDEDARRPGAAAASAARARAGGARRPTLWSRNCSERAEREADRGAREPGRRGQHDHARRPSRPCRSPR